MYKTYCTLYLTLVHFFERLERVKYESTREFKQIPYGI